ncbi:hypothetical protein [Microbaculum marinisediminis]|uniref:Uncharacterized protein n=1 Tax=Microbaculum marinisediminis TaxID=2931392 RepID=A0AAW5QSE7_9HYPH|nr:hypothetical protein [Microbaculum sp. A6E488]MCT8970802.1 hypothetical protein [Microbaculum sp. A6E488]
MLDERKNGSNNGLSERFDTSARPVVTVDISKYQSYIDDPDLDDAQKEDFLEALWSVVVTFVELGFGVHPLQEVCGQDSQTSSQSPKEAFDKVKSNGLDKTKKLLDSSQLDGL